MTFLAAGTWWRFGVWLLVGLVVYAACGYRATRKVITGGSAELTEHR